MAEEYPLVNGYDPKDPLPDFKREKYAHEIIRCDGNKVKAWKTIYMPELIGAGEDGKDLKLPRAKANYPYVAFRGKQMQARYKYLVDQHLDHCGIDTRHLLMKSAKLVDTAVAKRDIQGFSTMVNTILKLKGEDVVRVAQITKEVKLTEEDMDAVKGIFSEL